MEDDRSREAVLETLAAPASTDATLSADPGRDATIASVPPGRGRERPDDYAALATVDRAHYAVGAEVARGGMGRIVTARDRRIGRTVAIKELLHASGAARARFEREARITARLQHPSIVGLLEAGAWPDGEPFYTMRLVKGESLDRAIARRRTTPERLGLLPSLITVVDALAYAHSERVIHRDLKPGNVLVGAFGEVVVIDWGLAKDLADRDLVDDEPAGPYRAAAADETVAGAIMGTPAYMAPEQAAGERVDERADVYALGAMLYHLLAGVAPYTGATTEEVLERAMAGRRRPLVEAAPDTPPDLLTIVEKAMAPRPEDRYPSARELADDLKKFQTGQLVGAHRYTTAQLVRRWLRRHRGAVTIGAVALVTLAVVGVVAIRRIVAERARADQQRAVAVDQRGRAEELMDFMLFDLRDKLAEVGRLDLLAAVAEQATGYYRDADAQPDDERRRHAKSLQLLGDVLRARGDGPAALARYREAVAIHEARRGDPGAPAAVATDLASAHVKVAQALLDQGDTAAALAAYATARQLLEEAGARHDVAILHSNLGNALTHRGDLDGAVDELRAAVAIGEELAEADPDHPDRAHELCTFRHNLGNALTSRGDTEEAARELEAAIATCQALSDRDPRNAVWRSSLASAHDDLALALQRRDDYRGALEHHRRALVLREQLRADDPGNADAEHEVAASQVNVGDVLIPLGEPREALEHYRLAIATLSRLAVRNPAKLLWRRDLMIARSVAASASASLGDVDEAIASSRAAVETAEALLADEPDSLLRRRDLMMSHEMFGDLLSSVGHHDEALAAHRAGLEQARLAHAAEPGNRRVHREVGVLQQRIAGDLYALGRGDEYLTQLRESHATGLEVLALAPDDPALLRDVAVGHNWLTTAYLEAGDPASALVEARAELAISERLAAAYPDVMHRSDLATSLEGIAKVHAAAGDHAEAKASYRAALAILEELVAAQPDRADLAASAARLRAASK